MHDEINRNMVLMGCKNLGELNSSKLILENRGIDKEISKEFG